MGISVPRTRHATALGAILVLCCGAAQADDTAQGESIYRDNCIDCHMEHAEGDGMAPDIRGVPRNSLRRAMGGFDAMPEFELSKGDVAELLSYLHSLKD
ncbi:c-type cytochrome [Tropicimonas isoalkanivorans]|uniref:Cytochrome C oxidase, cbb3-type, subunit III n=1 Tax=Tropicimonas isoalkanivorans TaxID=441112 RepID=A0A1I1L288_9RHOB|nr:cytochrome c [Tropicimonas isoalkanivorans]SFC66662.1 Cytochrome C oxidase, cbb3-type, subunit III [Tropicimonas isoalkanivorans]